MVDTYFDGWSDLLRILLAAPAMYVALIAFIRVSGKRSTSQMNNFDWVVTVALGSITAGGVMLENVSVAEALLAAALLLALQWLLTTAILHSPALSELVKAEPRLLVRDGELLRQAMRRERVTEKEVRAALRERGLTDVGSAKWVILETDASFSVISRDDADIGETRPTAVPGIRPG